MKERLKDFLDPYLLGEKFLLVRGLTEVLDHETKELVAYRGNVNIQDEESPFFMEMFQLKINTLQPTIPVSALENNKTMLIEIKDLTMGQFNGNLWFSCSDIVPVKK